MSKIAAILIRGLIGSKQEVKDTLKMLNLQKKNNCVVLEANDVNKGMLNKVRDYITYGEVNEDTLKKLESRKVKDKKHYALMPPRGGFERKGIKIPFGKGGALGPRDNMNELISKMV